MDAFPNAFLPFFKIWMLIAMAYGLLSTALLMIYSRQQAANKLLALWCFIWGTSCFFFYDYVQARILLPYWIGNLFGPLIPISMFPPLYLYIKHLLSCQKRFDRSDLLHLTPLLLYGMITFWILIDSHWNSIAMMSHPMYAYRSITFSYIASTQGIVYYFLNIHLLKKREQNLKLEYSDIEELKLNWVRFVNQFNLPIMILGTASTVIKTSAFNPMALYMSYHFLMAICLVYITFKLVLNPLFLTGRRFIWVDDTSGALEPIEDTPTETKAVEDSKECMDVQADPAQYQPIVARLEKLMLTEKLFLDHDINLHMLSKRLEISRNQLSFVLNHILHKTFYDYINGFRIEEAKMRMQNPKYVNYAISAIAIDAGFKSKAVFYRLFKDSEGLLPTEYRDKLKK